MVRDYLRLYRSLNKNRVKYLIIGGIACIVYGVPRTTLDVDIFIEPTPKNAERLLKALKDIEFGTAFSTTAQKIIQNEINVFEDYIRLDVITKPKGIAFAKAWKSRNRKTINGVRINLASVKDIIRSKQAAGRSLDIEDVKILKRAIHR